MIEPYASFPGDHCGSVAMRGLLHHYCGLSLPEEAVFGLGAGAAAVYLSGPAMDPAAVLFGRTVSMEQDLATNLQVDYREQTESDDDRAWEIVRDEVLAGRPTMLSGDIFYLDYREFKVHFPSHRFVLLGFDDEAEQVFIADRIRPVAETCSKNALRLSRNPPEGLSTQNLWGRFHGTEIGRDLREATRRGISQCAKGMLTGSKPPVTEEPSLGLDEGTAGARNGIAAIEAFADDLPSFEARDDAAWIAGFNASCIEKFGNGGGNFRRLYSRFLNWARELDPALIPAETPELAWRAADHWTATSAALFRASEGSSTSGSSESPWLEAAREARKAAGIELELFSRLADATD